MAKKASSTYMTQTECIAGAVFFAVYLLVMPMLADKLFDLAGTLLDISISAARRNTLYYYVIFAVTVLLFHGFLARTTTRLLDDLNGALTTLFLALVGFYGANELLYRVGRVLWGSRVNLNDTAIAAQISDVPRLTALIVIFLAPFVEEVLFRGLVFGCIRDKSRIVAYPVSAALFALLHVWAFAHGSFGAAQVFLLLQYLVPGLVFAWAFDRTDTLWTPILLHALVNALALWTGLA